METGSQGAAGQELGAQQPAGGAGQEPPAGQQQGQQGQEPNAGQQAQGQEPSPEAARLAIVERELAEARQEAARYRTSLREREQGDMTEQERMAATLTELTTERDTMASEVAQLRDQLAQRDLRDEATNVARSLGFRDPDLAHRLVDAAKARNAAGELDPEALAGLLKAELASKPYLGTGGAGDGAGGQNAGPAGGDMNDLIRGATRAARAAR